MLPDLSIFLQPQLHNHLKNEGDDDSKKSRWVKL
jgi:hypothetical protein